MYQPHIGLYDYAQAACSTLPPEARVVFLTMLRDPIARVLSEYVHITENLDGAAYGRTWNYN